MAKTQNVAYRFLYSMTTQKLLTNALQIHPQNCASNSICVTKNIINFLVYFITQKTINNVKYNINTYINILENVSQGMKHRISKEPCN